MRYDSKPDFWGTDLLTLHLESALTEVTLNLSQSYSFAVEVVPTFDAPQVFVEAQGVARANEEHPMCLCPEVDGHVFGHPFANASKAFTYKRLQPPRNASIEYLDFSEGDYARVHVKAPIGRWGEGLESPHLALRSLFTLLKDLYRNLRGRLSFPELDVMMDSEDGGLTEFAADGELDLRAELEMTTRAAARQGAWPAISRYETPTGEGAMASKSLSLALEATPWRARRPH